MSESILYYPTIDIQDGAWLRSAALYWDEVCSIVPDQDYPDLSPELLYLEKRGYYRAIYPKDVFTLIHYRKMPKDVIRIFTENDMVRVNEDGWLEMDGFFAQQYMRLLAEFITKHDKKDMTLGTDKLKESAKYTPNFRRNQRIVRRYLWF